MRAPPRAHRSGDTRRSRIALAAIALSGGVPGAGGKGAGAAGGGEPGAAGGSAPAVPSTGAGCIWLGLNPCGAREGPVATGPGAGSGGMSPPCMLVGMLGGGMSPSAEGGTWPEAAAVG